MKILVIGGYGSFGRRLTENLLAHHAHKLVVAGRSVEKAKIFQQAVRRKYNKTIEIAELNVRDPNLESVLATINPDIVVNTAGPYQLQHHQSDKTKNYRVARACITVGSHYVDLADDRYFVTQFANALDKAARNAGLSLISGASTVPGVSGAVIDHFKSQFNKLSSVYFGISPGNQFDKGKATVGSILSYTGQPFPVLQNGGASQVYGWQGLRRYDFGNPIGIRWMANCQIPDLDLLPQRYPDLNTVHFQAGLELRFMHFTMWLLATLVRVKLISNPERLAGLLSRTSQWFNTWGTDKGAMFVRLQGKDERGNIKTLDWQLIAEKGEGPNIPVIAAELVINKIASGELSSGAYPCVGLFTLADFLKIAQRWNIYTRVKPISKANEPGHWTKEVKDEQITA